MICSLVACCFEHGQLLHASACLVYAYCYAQHSHCIVPSRLVLFQHYLLAILCIFCIFNSNALTSQPSPGPPSLLACNLVHIAHSNDTITSQHPLTWSSFSTAQLHIVVVCCILQYNNITTLSHLVLLQLQQLPKQLSTRQVHVPHL